MDNTLTGAIPPGGAYHPELNVAEPATAKKRELKSSWKFLGSATALLVALGAVVDQGADLGKKLTDAINIFQPATSEWTEDEAVVIEPNENIDAFTIQLCDSTQESGESLHIALLLERSSVGEMPPTFVLKKKGKGCRGETGRLLMNTDDFNRYIGQPRKADFKLSYIRAHLYSLDTLVQGASDQCNAESTVNKASGGNKS